ncbi:cytochrome P450 [Colletotrichum orchidophilum]|uniref:Cytochrome P450 n=1 Tax=Colletotrichum orchidophilum TaxID=1209926 RepID=A0A1G4BGZ7_9PEZI|nr:cytochrome P450 [Colletotrichum orchidophilum]OHF00645.1 cytochrome P450 [Colletotrichum orchidophilum]
MRYDDLRKEYREKLSPRSSRYFECAGCENGGFEPCVDKIVARFVSLVESRYMSTSNEFRPMEFSHKSQYFALDVISELSFGEALGFLANNEYLFGYVATNNLVFPYLRFMLNILSTLVEQTIAGSDSTATAVRITMLYLLNIPASLIALRREMDNGIAQGRISSPIRDSEARQLPYLQAVIREAHNNAPFLIWCGQCGKDAFGCDVDVFRPECWLEAAEDEERFGAMCGVVDLAFGHGRF